jgi:UDP-3-O-[3-hydroxymyristoyl] glucosamine N-acyltransferase
MDVTLKELAELVGGKVSGDGSTAIRGVNGLQEAGPGEIAFLANRKYTPLLVTTRASAVIVGEDIQTSIPAILVKNPDMAFTRVAERFNVAPARPPAGVHPAAVLAPDASIGKGVAVGACTVIESGASIGDNAVLYPQVYVGAGARIGPDCILYPQVTVRDRCVLGSRVILHSGTVIGSDGFGYVTENGVHRKIPQVGIVVVEDDVEIGANVTVDRARFDRTIIRRGAKIDNLVQIAHNVIVGEGSLIAAQAGIAGSTRLGKYVMLGGQAGVTGHVTVGDQAAITAQAGVSKDVAAGRVVSGEHAVEIKTHLRQLAALSRLPELIAEIKELRQEIDSLKKKLGTK